MKLKFKHSDASLGELLAQTIEAVRGRRISLSELLEMIGEQGLLNLLHHPHPALFATSLDSRCEYAVWRSHYFNWDWHYPQPHPLATRTPYAAHS